MTNVQPPPPSVRNPSPQPSAAAAPPPASPRFPAPLNDDDNIARSEWPDDTRADTPQPCHWSARRMDGIRGFRRLAASSERPGRMRAAARTCVIRRLDRRRGRVTRDVTIIPTYTGMHPPARAPSPYNGGDTLTSRDCRSAAFARNATALNSERIDIS